jgi:Prenyltransferase and squalene oxidase repeat
MSINTDENLIEAQSRQNALYPSRRLFLASGMAALLSSCAKTGLSQLRTDYDEMYTAEVDSAIERGIEYLVNRQLADGSFATTKWGQSAAVCSLGGISLLGRGVRPGVGRLGKVLENVGQYVLSCCQDSGFICNDYAKSHGDMYEHGFSTLFIAELYGTGVATGIGTKLRQAVDLIIRSQNNQGGWRYKPMPADADISVTVCQAMALRAARNAGIAVPSETVDRLVAYIRRSQNADGGFMYQLTGGESRFPLTAAASVALYNAGIARGNEIEDAMQYLIKNYAACRSPEANYFYYAHYYSIQAFRHFGGEHWPSWYNRLRDIILTRQQPDGGWFDHSSTEYGTAMACIILNMPRTVLPIFQS